MLRLTFIASLVLAAAACGQSGDLYLPDPEPVAPAATAPEEDAQKKKDAP